MCQRLVNFIARKGPQNRVYQTFCSFVSLDNLWIRLCTPKIGEDQKKGLHVQRVLFFCFFSLQV